MDKDTKIAESRVKVYLAWLRARFSKILVYSPHIFNNFNFRQIILNKHLSKTFVILFGSVILIWQFAFLSMVHGNIQDIYFMLQILD